ncbi:MAG: nSTAND1 domain-containing NTPase, partial [Anaerolineales bacterium]
GEPPFSAGRDVNVSGDLVARDKITVINNYIQQLVITPAPADGEGTPPEPGDAPYKGLQYFDEADAGEFFGREALTAKVIGRLSQLQFLTVIGASGSGKSSLIRAGVIPALRKGQRLADGSPPPTDSGRWDIRTLMPTAHPLDSLAATLARDEESVTAAAALARDLGAGYGAAEPRALTLAAQRVLSRNGKPRLLLFVDQFEEVFTLCKQPAEREAFVNQLISAAGPIAILIALRADFYAQCSQFAGLRELVSQQQEYIGAMSEAELARAILEPAKRGGWQIQAGLVEQMLDEVGGEPGALPLLSHALLETWLRRRGRTLTLSGYREAGGIHGAIAQTAESVFRQRLSPDQQAIARMIFIRLTELGETAESPDTRRRVPFSELMTRSTDEATINAVLAILTDARLVIADQDEVEVAHEALIREWPTLRHWLTENREGLLRQRQLTDDAHEWEKLGRDAGGLYRGAKLKQMGEWAERFREPLSALESEFMQASQENAQREAAEAQRSTLSRRAQWVLGGLSLALIGVVAYFLVRQILPPQKMDRAFNIAVAQFAGSGNDGPLLSQWAYERLIFEFKDDPNILVWVDSAELKREKNVAIGAVSAAGSGNESPAAMAERLNADVIVYGDITSPVNGFAQLQIKFYVAPQLNRDLGAMAGDYQIGAPLTLAAGNPGLEVKQALGDQVGVVAQISLGLTYEVLSRSDDAIRAFEKANTYLPNSEIAQFLLGQEYLFAAQKLPPDDPAFEANVSRAQMAFEQSLQRNPQYARARIGLGSVYFIRAQTLAPQPEDCEGRDPEPYQPALPLVDEALTNYETVVKEPDDTQAYGVSLGDAAAIGLGTSYLLRAQLFCGLGERDAARQATNEAVALVNEATVALAENDDYRLLAQAYQVLGTIYEWQAYFNGGDASLYRQAIGAYEKCIEQGTLYPVDTFLRDEVIAKLCTPSRDELRKTYGGGE